VKITLGGQDREIAPLSIAKSKLWREEAIAVLNTFAGVQLADFDPQRPLQNWEQIFKIMLTQMPEQVERLTLRYLELADPSLSADWIIEHATDGEIADALIAFVQATFAVLWKLGALTQSTIAAVQH
jgi:hypothetical protein